jgi:leucyl aminopeptidase
MAMSTRLVVTAADVLDAAALAAAADGPVIAVGVPVVRSGDGPRPAPGVPERLNIGHAGVTTALSAELAARRGFRGDAGQSLVVASSDGPALVYLGCGDPGSVTTDTLRRSAASLVRGAGRSGVAVYVLPEGLVDGLPREESGGPAAPAPRRAAQAVTEGAVLAGYRFTSHKTDTDESGVDGVVVAGAGLEPEVVAEGVRRGASVAEAVCFARDLVNEPPSTMSPALLAAAVQERLAGGSGVTLEVWDEDRIVAERLGGLLGVARGSAEPPRLIRAVYEPADPVQVDGKVPHVVLVGKGITFDSGGLSLKTPEGMTTMKTDMSGAAAVMAAVSACADLGVRLRVTAIAPVTENMPGGRATKPGDVLTIRNGRTIEVLNTDAEGRLVLADGLSLAAESAPDAIVDLATLTGACVVALGRSIAGLFGNDDALVARVGAASERAGEPTWPLPLPAQYRGDIDSEVADMKNVGKSGQAGAIAAAMLLERFVGDVPWAHLDIAGPARSDDDDGILTKGGTGFGVRTLLELVEGMGRA